MDLLINWVKNIAIFMILSSVVLNLLGNSQYRKYASLITGMILVVLIAEPLLKLFDLSDGFQLKIDRYSILTDSADMNGLFLEAEENRDQIVMSEYNRYLEQQVAELVSPYGLNIKTIHFEVEEDSSVDNYGSIHSIRASFTTAENLQPQAGGLDPVQIDKVKINTIDINKDKADKPEEEKSVPTPFEIKIKNLLADFYNLKLDNIIISIWEEQDGG